MIGNSLLLAVMAYFFLDTGSGTAKVDFIQVAPGKSVKIGVSEAKVSGQWLIARANNPSVAVVTGHGTKGGDGTLRGLLLEGLREGNVMVEARLVENGQVFGFAQAVVSNAVAAVGSTGVSSLALKAVEVAREELAANVRESGDNTGPRVDEYERLFGMQNQAWCAAFVYFCFNTAAGRLGMKNPLVKDARADGMLVWAQRNGRMVDVPAAGDILIVMKDGRGRHAGLVVGPPKSTGKVPSIEGNTYDASRVDGVYAKSQTVANCKFIRV